MTSSGSLILRVWHPAGAGLECVAVAGHKKWQTVPTDVLAVEPGGLIVFD